MNESEMQFLRNEFSGMHTTIVYATFAIIIWVSLMVWLAALYVKAH
jgi:hypothetical protein